MADDVDRANEITESLRTGSIASISVQLSRKNPSIECIDCDEDIELARRTAIPSAIRCIACQEAFEIHSRTHRN